MEFTPFEADIEVNGQTVWAIVDGFRMNRKIPSRFLIEEGIGKEGADGIVEIDAQGWYPQGCWLNAFRRIAKEVGDAVLLQIGMAIPENAIFPPWVKNIDDAIRSIDIAYHLNHRRRGEVMFDLKSQAMSEGIGHYGYQRDTSAKCITSECRNPYPCTFDRGIVTAMARRFEPQATVTHDDAAACRKQGADSCTYIIAW